MKKVFTNVLITIFAFIFLLLFSTTIVTKAKPIYYTSINKFDIIEDSGYDKKTVVENYSYIIDYLFNDETEFHLPSMEYSEDGATHFYEVKQLYNLAEKVMVVTFILLCLLIIFYNKRFKDFKYLKYISISLVSVPLLIILIVSSNFDFFFTLFHKLLFNNNKWIFDPRFDPIITVLPEEFFSLCAFLIVLNVIVVGLILLSGYVYLSKKKSLKVNINN